MPQQNCSCKMADENSGRYLLLQGDWIAAPPGQRYIIGLRDIQELSIIGTLTAELGQMNGRFEADAAVSYSFCSAAIYRTIVPAFGATVKV